MESSSVLEKASMSCGGSSRINPIVSLIRKFFHFPSSVGNHIVPTLVPRVAKSLSSASTHFFVREFVSVDFPALVYPTTPIV